MTPEQRKKIEVEEAKRKKDRKERYVKWRTRKQKQNLIHQPILLLVASVDMLAKKLIERIRPFVEAKHPGVSGDPETMAFTEKIKQEADDLKLESFGIEVRVLTLCS